MIRKHLFSTKSFCRFWYEIGFVIEFHITAYIYKVRKDMISLLEGKIRKLIRKWFWFFRILIYLFIWISMHDWTKSSMVFDVLHRWNDIQWHLFPLHFHIRILSHIHSSLLLHWILDSTFQNNWVSFQKLQHIAIGYRQNVILW